jgi:hypothetical protein
MAERIVTGGSDPAADGGLVAWHVAGETGVIVVDGRPQSAGGAHPALGGNRLAVIGEGVIQVRETSGPRFNATIPAPGADAVAVSAEWVAWRAREAEGDAIYAVPLGGGQPRRIAKSSELGRPAIESGRIAYHVPGRTGSRIVIAELATGKRTTVRRERRALLTNPSLAGGRLLFVRSVYTRQELRLGPQRRRNPRRDRRLWSMPPTGRRDAGHEPGKEHHKHGWPRRLWPRPKRGLSAKLWTTALAADVAYVTLLRQVSGAPLEVAILRVER